MSTFGGLTFAIGYEYQRMAYALALSMQRYDVPLTVVVHREDHSRGLFKKLEHVANIVTIAGRYGRFAYEAHAFNLSPYDVTVKFDADMIVPAEVMLDHYRKFTTTLALVPGLAMMLDGTPNSSTVYRPVETQLDMPVIYSACFGFTKSERAERFFKEVAKLFDKWYAMPNLCKDLPATTDSIYSAAWASMGMPWHIEYALPFVHMKPKIAGRRLPAQWIDKIPYSLSNAGVLRVNSHVVRTPFHYHEKKFMTDAIIEVLEQNVRDFQPSEW